MTPNFERQIITMGGGSFMAVPDKCRLERYVLSQVKTSRPRVLFLPTASGESPEYTVKFYEVFNNFSVDATHFSFFKPCTKDLRDFFLSKDVIYVGGGNTKSMLALWREWGVDKIIKEAWERGIVLCGVSAGMICWFEEGITDSIPGDLTPLPCLGILPGSSCPHYDSELERRPTFHRLLSEKQIRPGLACDDGAAAHFKGTELFQVVTSRPHANAYALSVENGKVLEKRLVSKYLG